jgi:hypothetical protein
VPVYWFSSSAGSETTASMATAPPNVALVCVPSTSITNAQNVLPIPAETSFTTPNTLRHSDISLKKLLIPDVSKGHSSTEEANKIFKFKKKKLYFF